MPEEINRIVTDHLSSLLFCPTTRSCANLAREGIRTGVHHVGDVMYDAAKFAAARVARDSGILHELELEPGSYALASVHRAENADDPTQLGAVMAWLAERAKEAPVILPIHPRTRDALIKNGIGAGGVTLIEPVSYFEMARLIDGAYIVYTDSGGLQKEAYFHRKPCVTLRTETEWVELIEAGWNRLWTEPDYRPRREIEDYGKGNAAQGIVDLIIRHSPTIG
jgi:UDP-GlcNAc3NAcA epimerase